MAKVRTKKIAASDLEPGMAIVIPAQRGVVTKCCDANSEIPSMSKCILYIELDATHGPWKGTAGRTLILNSDTVEVEVKPRAFQRLVIWLFGLA